MHFLYKKTNVKFFLKKVYMSNFTGCENLMGFLSRRYRSSGLERWVTSPKCPYSLCRGIIESSGDRGAIRLGKEVGGEVGDSSDGIGTILPSFGSRNGGKILRAAIIHYKAISPSYSGLGSRACPKASRKPAYKGVRT